MNIKKRLTTIISICIFVLFGCGSANYRVQSFFVGDPPPKTGISQIIVTGPAAIKSIDGRRVAWVDILLTPPGKHNLFIQYLYNFQTAGAFYSFPFIEISGLHEMSVETKPGYIYKMRFKHSSVQQDYIGHTGPVLSTRFFPNTPGKTLGLIPTIVASKLKKTLHPSDVSFEFDSGLPVKLTTANGIELDINLTSNIVTVLQGGVSTEYVFVPRMFEYSAQTTRVAFVIKSGKKVAMVIDGNKSEEFSSIGFPIFSPNGKRFAYTAKTPHKKWVVVVDGKKSQEYLAVKSMMFGPNSEQFIYAARLSINEWVMVINGQVSEKFYDVRSPDLYTPDDFPVFSYDGKRFIYTAKVTHDKWALFDEGNKSSEFSKISQVLISPDSAHVAFIAKSDINIWRLVFDGVESPEYRAVKMPLFSKDSSRFVYAAKLAYKKWVLVSNDQPSEEYLEISSLMFGPKGVQLLYVAKISYNKSVLVLNDKVIAKHDDIKMVHFSKSGNNFLYAAKTSGKWSVMFKGNRFGGNYIDVKRPIFSPDESRIAFMAEQAVTQNDSETYEQSPERWVMVLDGTDSKKYISLDMPQFSPNSSRFVFAGKVNLNKWVFVEGENESKPYLSILLNTPVFSADGRYMAYAAKTTGKMWVPIINGQVGEEYVAIGSMRFIPKTNEFTFKVLNKNSEWVSKSVKSH